MGRPIVYCSDCGRSLREEEFDKGTAGMIDHRPFCSTCRKMAPPTSTRNPVVSSGRTPKAFVASPAKTPSPALIAAMVGAAATGVLIFGLSMGKASKPPAPPPPVVVAPPPPPPRRTESDSAERAAAEKERAERFERFLKDIRAGLDDPRFDQRREEIRGMFATAAALAGPRKAEVDSLMSLFALRDAEAGLKAGLVGHWKLDDLSGESAADASGNNLTGRMAGKGAWTAAKIGSGFEVFGGGEHIELPDSPILKNLHMSAYTIAAWYQPKEVPSGDGPLHAIVIKPGHHVGLSYVPPGRFKQEFWLGTGKLVGLQAGAASPPGRFYHVAGTVDPAAGAAALYLDGALVKTATWPKTEMRSTSERWRIGVAIPSPKKYWGPSKGIIDDVRLYSRVLSAEEVKRLYEGTQR